MTTTRQRQLDGMHARMLRAALGLPPAIVSRTHAPTERIYGSLPFFSEQMAKRRVAFFGHALREHERGVHHQVVSVLLHATEKKKAKEWNGGGRRTVARGLMLDCRVDHIEPLAEILRSREKCRKAAHDAGRAAREARIAEILKRRPEGFVYPQHKTTTAKGRKCTFAFTSMPASTISPPIQHQRQKRLSEMSEEELRLMMM
jgi:hypothetical protein